MYLLLLCIYMFFRLVCSTFISQSHTGLDLDHSNPLPFLLPARSICHRVRRSVLERALGLPMDTNLDPSSASNSLTPVPFGSTGHTSGAAVQSLPASAITSTRFVSFLSFQILFLLSHFFIIRLPTINGYFHRLCVCVCVCVCVWIFLLYIHA